MVVRVRESRTHGEVGQVFKGWVKRRRCVMHKTQRKDVIHEGRVGLGLKPERAYRELYDPDRFMQAYAKPYKNNGAMTPGVTDETADGMSVDKMKAVILSLQDGTFQWKPTKRVDIPKKNGKLRPLGLPTWTDQLVQEVIRSILEPYFEARFRDSSHGFRPGRGCHTRPHQALGPLGQDRRQVQGIPHRRQDSEARGPDGERGLPDRRLVRNRLPGRRWILLHGPRSSA